LRIATWNVNSIRARETRVVEWLQAQRPDVLCLQETKVQDASFPEEPFRALGYNIAMYGQKTYNGVAILSLAPLEDERRGFGESDAGEEARLLSAAVAGIHLYSAYVPNGQIVGTPVYQGKLRWLEKLRRLLEARHAPSDRVVVCGDFNIAPEERDVHDPEFWKTQVLFHPTSRAALQDLCAFGLVDTFRLHNDLGGLYTWWDYRQLAFPKNLGLRIDHILATKPLAALCREVTIDRQARKGPSPSDHAPVVATFDL
jgi:exodeoxyribonuclease-3